MDKPDINRLLEFQKLLKQFNQVERALHRKHKGIYQLENDSEHSYNLTMTAWYLARYFDELNVDMIIRYALVHDFLEVYAGDTYIFDEEMAPTQAGREQAALKKLRELWSDFSDLNKYIQDYENLVDPEARFVYALDKFMPVMTIFINDGYTWKFENSSVKKIIESRIDKIEKSGEVKPYFDRFCEILLESPALLPAE